MARFLHESSMNAALRAGLPVTSGPRAASRWDGYAAAQKRHRAMATRDGQESTAARIEGEPDPQAGTLEDWRAYRRSLAALPRHDANVRLAIAVADARIALLSERG